MTALQSVAPRAIVRELQLLIILVQFAVLKIMHWFLFWIPSQKAKIVEVACRRTGMINSGMRVEQWQDSIVTYASYRSLCRSIALDMRKKVKAGGPAYDGHVVRLDGTPAKLFDFQTVVRPLVVVFGSST